MIGYTTVGTNDLPRAVAFYDALFSSLNAKQMLKMDRLIAWGVRPGQPMFAVCKPYNGEPASAGNGVMVSLGLKDKEQVDAIYNKAIELGATSEGASGPRGAQFYCGYVRDLDGNKLNFFCMQ